MFVFLESIYPKEYKYLAPENIYFDALGHIKLDYTYRINMNFDGRGFVYRYYLYFLLNFRYKDYMAPECKKG